MDQLQRQRYRLSNIATEKLIEQWINDDYFPSDEEIFTLKMLGKTICNQFKHDFVLHFYAQLIKLFVCMLCYYRTPVLSVPYL